MYFPHYRHCRRLFISVIIHHKPESVNKCTPKFDVKIHFFSFVRRNVCQARRVLNKKNQTDVCKGQCRPVKVLVSQLVCNVGNQSHLTCAFDSNGKFSLVTSANACHTTGQNFSAFGEILAKFSNVFVVDCFNFFHAEIANLAACGFSDGLFNFFVFHNYLLKNCWIELFETRLFSTQTISIRRAYRRRCRPLLSKCQRLDCTNCPKVRILAFRRSWNEKEIPLGRHERRKFGVLRRPFRNCPFECCP